MATNWTAAEAIKVIIEGKDQESIQDITRRFPLISIAAAKGDMITVASAMPSHISMRKLESMLKGDVKESAEDEDQDEEEVEEKPAKKEKKEKEEKPAKKSKKVEEPEEDEEDEDQEDEVDYTEMSAKELYQLCKNRKIKVEQKQKPAVYIKALEKADKAAAKAAEVEEDDDDFEDEKPAKKDKKGAGKKKAAEADEDDEWDL